VLNDEVGQSTRVQLTARRVQAASETFALFEYVIGNGYSSFHTRSITDGPNGVNAFFMAPNVTRQARPLGRRLQEIVYAHQGRAARRACPMPIAHASDQHVPIDRQGAITERAAAQETSHREVLQQTGKPGNRRMERASCIPVRAMRRTTACRARGGRV